MVKPPTFDSNGMKRGAWSKEEDDRLRAFVHEFGHKNWRLLPLLAGLARCGKSCRLRWVNYLKPGLKREKFSKQEEDLIIKLHNQLGNKWSAIAAKFPGRTDNEIKNYYHAHIKKRNRREKIIRKREPSPSPSPSSSSSCVTADYHQEESLPRNIEDAQISLSPLADMYPFEMATELTRHEECFDLPPFPAEEFHDFDFLFQEMQNDALNSADFHGNKNFWCDSFEQDVLDMELWRH